MSSQGQNKAMLAIGHAVHKVIGSCRETGELTSRAMDESLSLFKRLQLKMHLALCAFCRRNASQYALIRTALRFETPPDASPSGLSDAARQRIQDRLNDNNQ